MAYDAVTVINKLHSECIQIRRAAQVRGFYTEQDAVRMREIGVLNAEAKAILNSKSVR
jgi:hypothetical protein